jgi:hypothetical protein
MLARFPGSDFQQKSEDERAAQIFLWNGRPANLEGSVANDKLQIRIVEEKKDRIPTPPCNRAVVTGILLQIWSKGR